MEEKTKKKLRNQSQDFEDGESSDPDFEPPVPVSEDYSRRYATRRTRQVAADPPEDDLSRILPLDPPDCHRRSAKKRKTPAREDGPSRVGSAGPSGSSQRRPSFAAAAPDPVPAREGSSTSTVAVEEGDADLDEGATGGEDAEDVDLSMLEKGNSTSTATLPVSSLFKIHLAAMGLKNVAPVEPRPAGNSVDVSAVSSARTTPADTPEQNPATPWTDTETDSLPPQLGSPDSGAPVPTPSRDSPAFGPPLLRPVADQGRAASSATVAQPALNQPATSSSAAVAQPALNQPATASSAAVTQPAPPPPRRAQQRRKRSPRRSRSSSASKRPLTSPRRAETHSASAAVVNGTSEVSRASSSSRDSSALVSQAAVGLGLLCQAAEAAEAMAAAGTSHATLSQFVGVADGQADVTMSSAASTGPEPPSAPGSRSRCATCWSRNPAAR